MSKKLYERNIPLFHILTSLAWVRFVIPVIALFYIASEVSYEEFTVIMGVFALTILVLEVPSGAVADLLGRKKTMFLSLFFALAELVIISFFNGFTMLLIAKIIGGIAVSLSSGTFSSLIYETLKKLKREKEHKKISGSIQFTGNIAKAVVFIVGAFLFSIDTKLPALLSIPFAIAAFIPLIMIKDPYKPHKTLGLKNSYIQFKEGFGYFFKNKFLVYLSLFTVAIHGAVVINFSLSSVYLDTILIPIAIMGVIQLISSLIMAYGNKHASWFEKKLGEKRSFFTLQQFSMVGMITMSFVFPFIGVIFYMLLPLTYGILSILINNALHDRVPATHRATTVSVQNLFAQLGIFILYPLMGYTQAVNYSLGYILLFVIILFFAMIAQRYANKNKISFLDKVTN